jgi:hypothetical protein
MASFTNWVRCLSVWVACCSDYLVNRTKVGFPVFPRLFVATARASPVVPLVLTKKEQQ